MDVERPGGDGAASSRRDDSAGYDAVAQEFIRIRDPSIGVYAVRTWARELPPAGTVLDLGCGHGVPVAEVLLEEGLSVFGVDASPALAAAFRERFPQAQVACEPVQRSGFFGRTFDGVIAWGLLFLLPPEAQRALIHRIGPALAPGGRLFFTAPAQACTWVDVLTGRESVSLGAEEYWEALSAAGLALLREGTDEGQNHYFVARKP